ncbi:globin family protein [Caenispirillum bisanense]|uniref:Nitric oxide dioxygenase n=1 Tax=Caenispirillum bisanense TaxID=414052 RepID=A0A286H0U3_9PROT|nr:globin family protein [Caenispirillum bisanense]SOE01410.1 nitric oxide dioxygenase [Caenispirillum bisanense]
MTPSQIALVRETFAQVVPMRDQAAALFYGRLFELEPNVRPLFRADLAVQGQKLIASIAMVVRELDRLDVILTDVKAMARRHVTYGVQERHYAVVGDALLWTLEKGLGAAFTAEVREAWTAAYGTLAGAMIAAAREEPRAA